MTMTATVNIVEFAAAVVIVAKIHFSNGFPSASSSSIRTNSMALWQWCTHTQCSFAAVLSASGFEQLNWKMSPLVVACYSLRCQELKWFIHLCSLRFFILYFSPASFGFGFVLVLFSVVSTLDFRFVRSVASMSCVGNKCAHFSPEEFLYARIASSGRRILVAVISANALFGFFFLATVYHCNMLSRIKAFGKTCHAISHCHAREWSDCSFSLREISYCRGCRRAQHISDANLFSFFRKTRHKS